jgi:nicotinamide-nucleotide amidase
MQAEIISIGSELTSGAKLDTNSQWLSIELSAIGIPVCFHATMADDRAAMLKVFQTAVKRSDVVLVTGGLGPTLDDLTRELIAEVLATELVLDETSLHIIEEMFARRGRVMADRNRIQAMFPAGSEAILNPIGTAPGIWAEIPRAGNSPCILAAMPGVPSEMRKMYREQVASRLPHGKQVIRRAMIHTFGQGESNVEEMLGDLTARDRNPEVGITASSATITLRIESRGDTVEHCDAAIAESKSLIRKTLGDLVFGEDDDTLESVVIAELEERGETLATVECASHGLLSHGIATASPSGSTYRGSIVVGDETAWPGDATSDPDLKLASSDGVAALARSCREQFQADYALAISPFSKPDSDDPPLVFVALAQKDGVEVSEQAILSDLTIARPRAVKTVVNLLRLHLLGQS